MAGPARGTADALHAWWRSSLRVRVITTTMLLGMVLTTLLGTLLFQQVAEGLVRQGVADATADAADHARRAQELFDATDRRDNASLNDAADEIVSQMAPADGQSRPALLSRSLGNDRETKIQGLALGGLSLGEVPSALRQALEDDSSNQQVLVLDADVGQEQARTPSVFVGARIQIPRAGPHDLFLVYPMTREQATLDLVRQWFLVGGVALLALMGAMAWVATRMVAGPVGRAARVSQQLAQGELGERLPVRGSDELDRLATSFNTMADSLQSQIHQLEALSRLQQRFVSDVSHELRTPLTTIRMAGEVLHASRADFTGPVARSAELLYEELDRFEGLLTELLEISRYDSGAAVLEPEQTDLLALVRSVSAALGHLADRSGSRIDIDGPREPVLIDIDTRRVSRILRNVIGNAIEHGNGKPIEISVAQDESVVAVSVRDHGVGLAPGEGSQVFERFWRADPARTRTTGGTGLGLAIALEDARLHGGWLQASGRPGQGATFRLTLPRVAGSVLAQEPPPVPFRHELDTVTPKTATDDPRTTQPVAPQLASSLSEADR